MKSSQYYAEQYLFPWAETLTLREAPETVILRPVSDDSDLSKVRELLQCDFGLLPDLYRLATSSADVIVAESCCGVIAMAILMKLKAHDSYPSIISVPWISVDLRFRRRGVASALIRYIKGLCERSGINRIDAAKNPCSRNRFLTKEGFRPGRKSPAFHDGFFSTWHSQLDWLPLTTRPKFIPLDVLRGHVRIRPARDTDKNSWKMLVLQACELKVDHDVMHSTYTADLRLVAERVSDGQVVGIVAANVGWVIMLGCEPGSRNCGLGSLLLFCALDWSFSKSSNSDGSSHVSLTPLTARAQRYYEKWGFIEEKGAKKDGYVTMRIELSKDNILPHGLCYTAVLSLADSQTPDCNFIRSSKRLRAE